MTDPPVTDPPVTDPPVTDPPAGDPPAAAAVDAESLRTLIREAIAEAKTDTPKPPPPSGTPAPALDKPALAAMIREVLKEDDANWQLGDLAGKVKEIADRLERKPGWGRWILGKGRGVGVGW